MRAPRTYYNRQLNQTDLTMPLAAMLHECDLSLKVQGVGHHFKRFLHAVQYFAVPTELAHEGFVDLLKGW